MKSAYNTYLYIWNIRVTNTLRQNPVHSSGDHNSDVLFTVDEYAYKLSLENDYMIKVIMIKIT